jgi:hypothetical protein
LFEFVDAAKGGDDGLAVASRDALIGNDLQVLVAADMLAAEEHGDSPEATTMLRLLACEDNEIGCGYWHHSSAISRTSHEQDQSLATRTSVETVEDGSRPPYLAFQL